MKPNLEEYKDRLLDILLGKNHSNGFMNIIDQLSLKNHSKADIYDFFLDFHREIQFDKRTKENEEAYDRLSDFIDGFTAWGKKTKILPNEPDL